MRTISTRRLIGAGALACLLALSACGDDPVRPEPIDGAGLRLVFDDVVPVDGEVLVELWRSAETLPPTCVLNPPAGVAVSRLASDGTARNGSLASAVILSPAQPDLCSRGTYAIRNILGEVVKNVAEEPWPGHAPAWNTLDDGGEPVRSGIYPIHWECIDSDRSFTFDGHYYVSGPDEEGACDWLVWSDLLAPAPGESRFDITGFPVDFTILTVEPGSENAKTVVFTNPYLLQVHVPGRPTFGAEVELEEGSFTEVRVTIPAS